MTATEKKYDTTSERYSHLAGLTADEIKIVMVTADTVMEIIRTGRRKRLDAGSLFIGNELDLRANLKPKKKTNKKRGRPRKRAPREGQQA